MLPQALFALALAANPLTAFAQSVIGSAPGFAKGTTGGAGGRTVTPHTPQELTDYLWSDEALTIVLTKTFDFIGTNGTITATGCAPYGLQPGCQLAINYQNWCHIYHSKAPSVKVTYDKAATIPLKVKSNKSLIGVGDKGVIQGKGLFLGKGVSNIIIQNIHITQLNEKYVWGGDAITLDGTSSVWIDHVTTSRIGRMMLIAGFRTNHNFAVTNCEFNGKTDYSATCNGEHYWGLFFIGQNDQITLKGNHIHHTSGRSPKIAGGTILHVVNNYWSDNSGHAFEGDKSYVLAEGNLFDDVLLAELRFGGSIYAPLSSDSLCESELGRSCAGNTYNHSAELKGTGPGVLTHFKGLECTAADRDASSVPGNVGVGKLKSDSSAESGDAGAGKPKSDSSAGPGDAGVGKPESGSGAAPGDAGKGKSKSGGNAAPGGAGGQKSKSGGGSKKNGPKKSGQKMRRHGHGRRWN